jgi:hypothetical protein
MPRFFIASFLVLGLLIQGCATHQSVAQAPVTPGETICWDPPPEKPTHPFLAWCKAHPWTVGVGTGLLVAGGVLAGGVIALEKTGAGAGLVWGGIH